VVASILFRSSSRPPASGCISPAVRARPVAPRAPSAPCRSAPFRSTAGPLSRAGFCLALDRCLGCLDRRRQWPPLTSCFHLLRAVRVVHGQPRPQNARLAPLGSGTARCVGSSPSSCTQTERRGNLANGRRAFSIPLRCLGSASAWGRGSPWVFRKVGTSWMFGHSRRRVPDASSGVGGDVAFAAASQAA